mgnify:CR=1 FL=1
MGYWFITCYMVIFLPSFHYCLCLQLTKAKLVIIIRIIRLFIIPGARNELITESFSISFRWESGHKARFYSSTVVDLELTNQTRVCHKS